MRNGRNLPYGGRRFDEERLPLVADFEHAGLGASTKNIQTTRAGRCVNRVVCVVIAVGTLCALGLAMWFHIDRGLSSHDAREARSPFPLIAHEIWLGEEMPAVKRMLFERNEEMLSPWGWHLRLWGLGDVTLDNFPHTYRTIKRGLKHHAETGQNTFSMVGDLMKFEILYRHGGLYLDTNVEMMRDPSPLFWDTAGAGREAFFVADPGDNRFISAGMIGALAPGSKLLGRVVENPAYLDGVDFSQHCIANALTGPVMLTMHLEHDKSLLETVSIFDRDVAYPIACGENYLDPCIHQLSEGNATTGVRPSGATRPAATSVADSKGGGVIASKAAEARGGGGGGGGGDGGDGGDGGGDNGTAAAMETEAEVTRALEEKMGTGSVAAAAAAAVARSMGSVGLATLGDTAETSAPAPRREGIFSMHSSVPLKSPPLSPPLPPGDQQAPGEYNNSSSNTNSSNSDSDSGSSNSSDNEDDKDSDVGFKRQRKRRRRAVARPTILDPDGDGIDGIDVDGFISNVHGGITSTAAAAAATVRKHHKAIAGKRGEKWHRHSVHSHVPPKLVMERNGAMWNVTVPCRAVARRYPDSYALDHFSVGGASWQQDCDRYKKANDMVSWVEDHVPPDVDLVHKWAMSAVRYLGGPEHGRELVKRVRLHQSGGVPGKARLLLVASSLRSGGALLNEMLETTADHPVDSKIWYREDGARADAFFVTYITLGDLWSHGAFRDIKPNSWQARLRKFLNESGVSARAIEEAHVDPAGFMDEVLSRLWELGIDLVHVMLTNMQSQSGLRAIQVEGEAEAENDKTGRGRGVNDEAREDQVTTRAASAGKSAGDSDSTAADGAPLNNTAILDALLKRFPDSPTVCLKRRNMLDAYVSLYRAEHGDAPWQLVAEPPPAPRAASSRTATRGGSRGAEGNGSSGGGVASRRARARAMDVNKETMTGVWDLEQQQQQRGEEKVEGESMTTTTTEDEETAEKRKPAPSSDGQLATQQQHKRLRGRQASSEAFGAFGPLPLDAAAAAAAAAVEAAQSRGAALSTSSASTPPDGSDPTNTWRPHRVRFDLDVFNWLEQFETEWLALVAARTRKLGRECEELVYEDNLLDEGRQAQTLTWLKERFNLNVNVEALPLQKLRRISTVPVTLRDFENPDDLDDNARSLLHKTPADKQEEEVPQ